MSRSTGEPDGATRGPAPASGSLWRAVLPGLLLLGLGLRTLGPVHDPDTWWHIRSGAELVRTWTFVGPDPWGTFATREWIRHQWLMDLAFGRADALGGLPAVAWLLPAMAVASGAAIVAVCRARASVLVSCVVAAVVVLAMSGSLSLRPQVVSFGFAAVVAGAYLAGADDLRARWWLVPLTWVWASCHGLWVVGPAMGLAVAAGLALSRTTRGAAASVAAVAVASVAAAALTPVGPRLLWAPFQVRHVTPFIEEWQRPSWTDPAFLAGLALVLGAAAIWRSARRRPSAARVLLLLLALVLVVLSRRTVGVGACVAAPLAAEALQSALPLVRERLGRREVALTALLAGATLAVTALLAPAVAGTPREVPEAMAPDLAALPARTVVCNSYDAGSWLLWRFPALRPVIDGRTELYTPQQIEAHLAFTAGAGSWSRYAEEHGCRVALVRSDAPVSADLRSGGWGLVRSTGDWVLWERAT
jgi:hypothetical protein